MYNKKEDSILLKALKLWYYDRVHWALLFYKGTLREDVCSRLIKPTTQIFTLNTPPHVWHYFLNTCTTGRNANIVKGLEVAISW
jgi:hypothetical protein